MNANRFSLGRILATPGAIRALRESKQSPAVFLARHAAGDWGDICPEDKSLNEHAIADEGRLLSAYETTLGAKLWIITEADRSATTILLPDEY